jgi:capsular polysaccharide transport system permease protein
MMHGFSRPLAPGEVPGEIADAIPPAGTEDMPAPLPRRRWVRRLRPLLPFLSTVVLPTLLVVAFEYLVAADQYQAEAHFMVRSPQQASPQMNGLGQMLGLAAGPTATNEAHSIGDYLTSHDAVAALSRSIDLPAMFRRPEVDMFTRLPASDTTPEDLQKYFESMVRVSYTAESGITKLSVRTFRPRDAQVLTEKLLELGEDRVNLLNRRLMDSALAAARAQLAEAEAGIQQAQAGITRFRQTRRDIDPDRTGTAQITMATQLEGQVASARAMLASMAGAIQPSSPQYVATARRVRALEAQLAAAQSRMAGPEGATAQDLGAYEELRVRQDFAAKSYTAAAAALQAAREQAQRQQLFVVRVVEPNLPVKSLYPKRFRLVATVFLGLLLAYGIGWLLLAGVREHAA